MFFLPSIIFSLVFSSWLQDCGSGSIHCIFIPGRKYCTTDQIYSYCLIRKEKLSQKSLQWAPICGSENGHVTNLTLREWLLFRRSKYGGGEGQGEKECPWYLPSSLHHLHPCSVHIKMKQGVPFMAQRKRIQLGTMRLQV